MAIVDADDLTGRTLQISDEEGEQQDVTMTEAMKEHNNKFFTDEAHVKFKTSRNEDKCEEILSCNC